MNEEPNEEPNDEPNQEPNEEMDEDEEVEYVIRFEALIPTITDEKPSKFLKQMCILTSPYRRHRHRLSFEGSLLSLLNHVSDNVYAEETV